MKKTHAIRIKSNGRQADFIRRGVSGLAAVELLKAHIDRTTSSKQVFSVTLEDGSPETRDRSYEQVEVDKATMRVVLAMVAQDWRTQMATVMTTADRLADEVKRSIADPAGGKSAVRLRQAMIGLQACRELMDDIVERED